MGRGSGVMVLASVLGGASVLAACLLPTFSDVLPGATTPPPADASPDVPADVVEPGDGGLNGGCDDTLGALAIWPMTEGTGSVVHDCSGRFPGTITGGATSVTWTAGRNGQQALQFWGGFVQLVDDEALRLAGPFTLTAWVAPSDKQVDTFGDILARYASVNTAAFNVVVTSGPSVALTLFQGTKIVQAVGTLTYGVYKHLAATYAPSVGVAEMFIDGKSVQTNPGAPLGLDVIPTPMTFGANGVGTSAFMGKIAGIRIYTRVLTPFEISSLAKL